MITANYTVSGRVAEAELMLTIVFSNTGRDVQPLSNNAF